MKIDENLVQRNAALQNHPTGIQCLGFVYDSPLFSRQIHHITDVFIRAHEVGIHHWFGNG